MALAIDVLQSFVIARPRVEIDRGATATGDRSKHCRSVAPWPNRNPNVRSRNRTIRCDCGFSEIEIEIERKRERGESCLRLLENTINGRYFNDNKNR